MKPRATLYVSCSHFDREFAQRLVSALRQKLDSAVDFVFGYDLVSPGDDLFVSMADALSKADALIAIVSPASMGSRRVSSEIAWALAQKQGNLPIFPVVVGSLDLVPHLLRSRVYINFADTETFEKNVAELSGAISRKLAARPTGSVERLPYAESLAQEFIEQQREELEELQWQESSKREFLSMRLGLAIAISIFTLTLIVFLLVVFRIDGDEKLGDLSVAVIAPIVGLLGTVLGFYFGSSSSRNENAVSGRSDFQRRGSS